MLSREASGSFIPATTRSAWVSASAWTASQADDGHVTGMLPSSPSMNSGSHVGALDSRSIAPRLLDLSGTAAYLSVSVCHGLLRLPGKSAGADREVAFAERSGIPVFSSVAELLSGLPPGAADAFGATTAPRSAA